MTILITRPRPSGEKLVSYLQRFNQAVCYTPLLKFSASTEINQLPHYISLLKADDLIFAVSTSAVYYANLHLTQQQQNWPKHVHYFAIGSKTAKQLESVTQYQVNYPQGRGNTENLITSPLLQQIAGKTALILRGNGGRELLAETLKQRQAHVIYCECYQRQPIPYNREETVMTWQEQQVDTILITSHELLQLIYDLVPECHRHWLVSCRLLVISHRLAQQAHLMGWRKIEVLVDCQHSSILQALSST